MVRPNWSKTNRSVWSFIHHQRTQSTCGWRMEDHSGGYMPEEFRKDRTPAVSQTVVFEGVVYYRYPDSSRRSDRAPWGIGRLGRPATKELGIRCWECGKAII